MPSDTAQIVKGACGIPPETRPDAKFSGIASVVAKTPMLWEPGTTITYSFFGGTKNQQAVVDRIIPEWTWYANLNLQRLADSSETAIVRISFDWSTGSWSSVGRGALNVPHNRVTMNLGWIEDTLDVSDFDCGTILHEWGHALGMMHEHQSPARGGSVTLNTEVVYEHFRQTQGWDDATIRSNVIDVYSKDFMANYSKFDPDSIMMYFMPPEFNFKGAPVEANTRLSEMDKAYMVINYPRAPGAQHPKALEWTLEKALGVVGVPPDVQKDILSHCNDISSLRARFASWNKETRAKEYIVPLPQVPTEPSTTGSDEITRLINEIVNKRTVQPANPSSPTRIEHGIWSRLVAVLKHPLFQRIVSGVVSSALAQIGLNPVTFISQTPSGASFMLNPLVAGGPYDPYATQQSLWTTLISILQDPTVMITLSSAVDSALDAHKPTDASDDIQHGIFADITSVLGHPAVRQILSDLVDSVLSQHGLNPSTIAQYAAIQQGVWTGLVGVLKHPAFQQVVSGIVGAVLAQRGIKPSLAPSSVEHGIFSDVDKLLSHPFVSTALTSLVNAVLVQRGLDPDSITTARPEIQQGIWSGVVKVLKDPAFQKAVASVINSTVTQQGLKPMSATDVTGATQQYPDNVQQSIWTGIVGLIKHPLFRNIIGSVVDTVLTQNAPNPAAGNPAASGTQYGLYSNYAAFPGNPLGPIAAQQFIAFPWFETIRKAVGAIITGASAQYTLNPIAPYTSNPATNNAQHGLYPNYLASAGNPQDPFAVQHSLIRTIIDVLELVGPLINHTFAQNALNPTAPYTGNPAASNTQYSNYAIASSNPQDPFAAQHGLQTIVDLLGKYGSFSRLIGHIFDRPNPYLNDPTDAYRRLYSNLTATPGYPLVNGSYYNGYYGGKLGLVPGSGAKDVSAAIPITPPESDLQLPQEA